MQFAGFRSQADELFTSSGSYFHATRTLKAVATQPPKGTKTRTPQNGPTNYHIREARGILEGSTVGVFRTLGCLGNCISAAPCSREYFLVILGLYRDNGKENGNYYSGLYRDYRRFYWGCINLFLPTMNPPHTPVWYHLSYSLSS